VPGYGAILLGVAAAALASSLLTWLAILYARRRAMLDAPGRRRSHLTPTPRGGGIGVVLVAAAVSGWLANAGLLPAAAGTGFALGTLAVGAIGWLDDHRPLPASLRLLVHLGAAFGFATVALGASPAAATSAWLCAAAAVFCLTSSVNVWNFMDGINGLVGTQSAWVAGAAMLAFGLDGEWGWSLLSACVAAAALGFLPFNFPHARVFLGDVGSGGLGFACGALLLAAVFGGHVSPWSALLIASALWLDAALTLGYRMLRRRRWYTAHREHLYQWLVRSRLGHPQVTTLYLAWNLLVVLPLLWLAHARPALAPLVLGLAVALGATAWLGAKRSMIGRIKSGRTD
jgi:UDP-N-acetylmuramyl pentapeptide phosphotransferase/UDP-N-acetylglucosamine-1-phosphate transferase